MPNFKNMKIEINEQQPLDEVVGELERLGYISHWFNKGTYTKFISTRDSQYTNFSNEQYCDFYCGVNDLTTLIELKNMEV